MNSIQGASSGMAPFVLTGDFMSITAIVRYFTFFLFLPASVMAQQWPVASQAHLLMTQSQIEQHDINLNIRWKCDLKSCVSGAPVVDENCVYVGTTQGSFFCIKRDDGTVIWEKQLPGPIISAAEAINGIVFTSCIDGFIYALSMNDGKIQWKHRIGHPVISSPVFKDGLLYIGDLSGKIRALNPKNGRLIWVVGTGGKITTPVVIAGDKLFYSDEAGGIFCRRINDGALVWEGRISGCGVATPILHDDLLIVPMMSKSELTPPDTDYLTAWNLETGNKIWTASKSGAYSVMSMPVVTEQTVWCFTVEGYMSDGTLRGFNTKNGQQVVERRMGRLVVDAALVSAGDHLYIAGQDGKLHIINSQTGMSVNEINLGSKTFSSPVIANDDLFIGCQNGYLYCFE